MTDAQVYERRWGILAVLCLSLMIIGLDNTILNVALPTLARDLSASGSELQWVVDSYVLVFAGLLLTAGAIGDRFGRKRALFLGLAIFATGSSLAAVSSSTHQLIAMRALMGVGGAFIMPTTLSILTNVFPPAERPKAIAMWAAVAGLAIPLGPVIGGWLLGHFAWGSVFLVNLPVIAAAFIFGTPLIPESRDPQESPLDPIGAVLSIAGLATLLYGVIEAPSTGWGSGSTVLAFVIAGVILTAFAGWELKRDRPMLDLRLFRKSTFTGACLAISLIFFALFGSLFFITQYLQFVLGYSALEAGIRIAPVAVGMIAGTAASHQLRARFGTRLVVTVGMSVVAVALLILGTLTEASDYGRLLVALVILSAGMGLTMAPATNSIMGSVPRENAGVGSAVNDAIRQIGGALGVAVLGSILATAYTQSMEPATSALPPAVAEQASDSIGATVQVAAQVGGQEGQALVMAANSSFVDAMGTALFVAVGFALAGALVAFLVLPSRAEEVESEELQAMPEVIPELQELET